MRHLFFLLLISALSLESCQKSTKTVAKWDLFEVSLKGPDSGNPFKDVILTAEFSHKEKKFQVTGFYDGDGNYILRFMPGETGTWTYTTKSNIDRLNGKSGSFLCSEPGNGNHGPVSVYDTYLFHYADSTLYHEIGTTCYAWIHQGDSLERKTLETLAKAPFNKVRMCIFPKSYLYNENEPVYYPFIRDSSGMNDYSRFNPAFFRHLEKRVRQLGDLGIEADLILFHPYDRWGYASMPDSTDEFYLRYVIARLSAFHNVWWSAANEFDFMQSKSMDDWDRIFEILYRDDPYHHLRSIHNGAVFYDHTKPWITHVSIQSTAFDSATVWRERYKKPLIFDECRYEGNIEQGWGNLTPQQMTAMFWKSLITGSYAGHGETYKDSADILWWSKGGVLKGKSPVRIAFYKKYLDAGPECGFQPFDRYSAGKYGEQYIYYFNEEAPGAWTFDLPERRAYQVEVVDTWNMTSDTLEGYYSGKFTIPLPGRKYMAVKILNKDLIFPIKAVEIEPQGDLFYKDITVKFVHPFLKNVRYTLDNSEPDMKSLNYTGPITIDKRTTIKAVAFSGSRRGETTVREFRPGSLNPAYKTEGLEPGIRYSYYRGDWQELPDFSKLKPSDSGTVKGIDISLATDQDYFGIVFKGFIKIPEDQVYTFRSYSDDGSAVYIDGDKVVDNDGIHGTRSVTGQAGLKAGYHTIEIRFFDNWYDQALKVFVSSPDMPEKPVDDLLFYRQD